MATFSRESSPPPIPPAGTVESEPVCSAEELSDARLLPREQVLATVERLVLDLLCSINAGTDPELLMVTATSSA